MALPDSSGAKHIGMSVGRSAPVIATPTASTAMSTLVTTTMLRKLRRRTCSRNAAELAPRMIVTILRRSSSTILTFCPSVESAVVAKGWSGSLIPIRPAMRSNSLRRGSLA